MEAIGQIIISSHAGQVLEVSTIRISGTIMCPTINIVSQGGASSARICLYSSPQAAH